MLELYRNIKKYRKLNNTTQLELAEAIGYSDRSIISKIENGVLFAHTVVLLPKNRQVYRSIPFTFGNSIQLRKVTQYHIN